MDLPTLLALVMLGTLIAYAVLAGADFGAGVWDFLSRGEAGAAHRRALAAAIGPVWEANHVWLIFLIVILFTCFPAAYAAVSIALFWPLHLVLVGIVLRGASFVFRAYAADTAAAQAIWSRVFGVFSAVTPMLLGVCLGAVSTGQIRADAPTAASGVWWASRFPLLVGVLALLLCAYLAAVYLAWETEDASVREAFRRKAIVTWWVAGVASVATIMLARADAPRLWAGLTSWPAATLVAAGALLAPVSLLALWRRRLSIARLSGAGQVATLLLGWGAAQWPYLV